MLADCGSFFSCWTLIMIFFCITHGLITEETTEDFKNMTRIIGGEKARHGQFPFMVSVLVNGEHFCGGSLLNPRWVLTAAHCVPREINKLSVFAGWPALSDRVNKGVVVNVSEGIVHPQYVPRNNYANDIALLKLSSFIEKSRYTQPVHLPSNNFEIPPGTPTILVGWGFIKTGDYDASNNLLYAQISTLSNERCLENYKETDIVPSQLCAGLEKGGIGQCSGDSGGPLMWDDYQVGIVSWSQKPCASPNHPGVFTRVSSYTSWIIQVAREHSEEKKTQADERNKSTLIFN